MSHKDKKHNDSESVFRRASEIEDFTVFTEGKMFPPLNKEISRLVISEKDYIVFLDKDYNVHWSCSMDYSKKMPPGYGAVLNRMGVLESESTLLAKNRKLELVRRLLGESIARLFDDNSDSTSADKILDKAEKLMNDVGDTSSRVFYLLGSVTMGLIGLLLMLLAVLLRACIVKHLGDGSFELTLGSLCGAPGAVLFVAWRSDTIKMNYAMGLNIHFLEGMIRGFVAIIGAFIVALAVKVNIIGGFVKETVDPLLVTLLLCLASGASERILPSLISKLEGEVSKEGSDAPDTTKRQQDSKTERQQD